MGKPEKKTMAVRDLHGGNNIVHGYNQACDDWEAYLPSEGDIRKTITRWVKNNSRLLLRDDIKDLAQAIAKRIGRS